LEAVGMENIEFMVDIDAPKEKVWQSLTDQDKWRKWWGGKNLKIEARMGGRFEQAQTGKDGIVIFTEGAVITVVPNHRFSFTWKNDNWDGETMVTFYLLPQNEKTKLYFLHSEWNNLSVQIREKQKALLREEWKEKLANLKYLVEAEENINPLSKGFSAD
jgi:uncharacterized protein YndB with AHSA1/START domain